MDLSFAPWVYLNSDCGMASQSWSRQETQLYVFEAQQALKAQIMDCRQGAGYSSEDGNGVGRSQVMPRVTMVNETSELIFPVAGWENKASH